MPDILAIVSKGIFEKDAQRGGKRLGLGEVFPTDRYVSGNRALEPLGTGGRLFLVTVRPPDEHLWLVGVLERLSFRDGAWVAAAPNSAPITDVTHLRDKIRFESGKGMSLEKGALGMSLQTPRALAAADVGLLLDALGPAAKPAAKARPAVSPAALALLDALEKTPGDEALRERAARRLAAEGARDEAAALLAGLAHLNAHDPSGLPCLCKACLGKSAPEVAWSGMTFARDFVVKNRRVLHFWAPKEILGEPTGLHNSVRGALASRLALLEKSRKRQERTPF